jgi:hypothetical protein
MIPQGAGDVAQRPSICLEPYELPICKLQILDEKSREITPVSLLGLFKTHAEFVRTLQQEGMRRIVMLRHLTPPQVRVGVIQHTKDGNIVANFNKTKFTIIQPVCALYHTILFSHSTQM